MCFYFIFFILNLSPPSLSSRHSNNYVKKLKKIECGGDLNRYCVWAISRSNVHLLVFFQMPTIFINDLYLIRHDLPP